MFGDYEFNLTIDNRTSQHVTYVSEQLIDGEHKATPTADIPPQRMHTNAYSAASSTHGVKGTEGTVVFQVGSDPTATVSIYWFISSAPFTDSKCTMTPGTGVQAKLLGFDDPSANIINVTLALTEA